MRRGEILIYSGICDICGAYGPRRDKVIFFSKGEKHLYICADCMRNAIRMLEKPQPKGRDEGIAGAV